MQEFQCYCKIVLQENPYKFYKKMSASEEEEIGVAKTRLKEKENGFASLFLSALASVWQSPVAERDNRLGGEIGSVEYEKAYTRDQFMSRVVNGFPLGRDMPELFGKEVLELGCGHGGVTCYLASLGAKRVIGIDINTDNFSHGFDLAKEFGNKLNIELLEMDCMNLKFEDESFDIVYADNAFEHYTDPERVMMEAFRVLRSGGFLLVPIFSSILSKYGLHLKQGLKLPWANLAFSEATIVKAMQRQAQKRPELLDWYPGLRNNPKSVRDLRKHKDLNDITHRKFLEMAVRTGFEVKTFKVHSTRTGRLVRRLFPSLERTVVFDVLSTGAGAVLSKP